MLPRPQNSLQFPIFLVMCPMEAFWDLSTSPRHLPLSGRTRRPHRGSLEKERRGKTTNREPTQTHKFKIVSESVFGVMALRHASSRVPQSSAARWRCSSCAEVWLMLASKRICLDFKQNSLLSLKLPGGSPGGFPAPDDPLSKPNGPATFEGRQGKSRGEGVAGWEALQRTPGNSLFDAHRTAISHKKVPHHPKLLVSSKEDPPLLVSSQTIYLPPAGY